MAVRQCAMCGELMQQGYAVDTEEINYYCTDECLMEQYSSSNINELTELEFVEWHDWQPHQMDAEDFQLLLNKLLSSRDAQDIADILDILDREEREYYAPEGVLNHFITYVNGLSYF